MYTGGKLLRLISDNFFNMIKGSLDDLGWFNPARSHLPVSVLPVSVEEIDDDDTDERKKLVKPNLVTVSHEDIISNDIELGSNLAEHSLLYQIDVYGEKRSLSMSLAGDIRDILEGRFSSIGRTGPVFDVFDLSKATPDRLFSCEIEGVTVDRSRFYEKPYQKHWYQISCDVLYSYADEGWDY